ncbi:MAG: mannose-6-phosphate isomerase, class I, partial [Clostridium sp.]|nr:mannose-6-phosphate isomerase, class I [Clostridium sp.]
PIFQERIWGGTKLKDYFNYSIPSDHTGECWAISAHKNGDCTVANGPLKGQTLSSVYEGHRELFARSESPVFPLLTKILDASENLSVQVHPDDSYAMQNENDLGKTECWYVIDCEEGAEIIYGHNASSRDDLIKMIDEGNWEYLLNRVKVKPGDFFYVSAGTIHALGAGTLILETQQSSDTTYRVYDYDRSDEKGQQRDLHIDEAKKVLSVDTHDSCVNEIVEIQGNLTTTQFVSTRFFTVEKWETKGTAIKAIENFTLVSVIEGAGQVNDLDITKGDHFILTSICDTAKFTGDLTMIISYL